MIEQLHFLRPWWFMALVPLGLMLLFLWWGKPARGAWHAVCESHLIPYILQRTQPAKRMYYSLLFAFAGVLAILALAGPAWQKLPQPLFKHQSALVVMLDLSKSMDARDIPPSRLERARLKLLDLLRLRKAGQTALVVYAGDAFTVTPLTDDTQTIAALVHSLSTDLMPAQGSRPDRALGRALALLAQAGVRQGSLLLMSDGVDKDDVDKLASTVVAAGHHLSVIAVGTGQGAPIPSRTGGFVKEASGQIVLPKLDESTLMALASKAGGVYNRLTIEDTDIVRVLAVADVDPLGSAAEQTEKRTERWREEGPWLLLLLLPVALLAFRRGLLLALLAVSLHWPDSARALEWQDLWRNADQKGAAAMSRQDYSGAASAFRDPRWQAVAHYRAGHYEQALVSLQRIPGADAAYNRGNALARMGQVEQAIESYEQALAEQPDHEDARHNLELLKKLQGEEQSTESDQPQVSPPSDQQKGQNNGQAQQQPDRAGQSGDQGQSSMQNKSESAQGSSAERQSGGQKQGDSGQAQQQKQDDLQSNAAARGNPETEAQSEEQQAAEQWLRRIPDDPGALLRRKFRYQYSRRGQNPVREQQQW